MKLHRTLTATLIAFCLVGSAAAAAPVAEISTDASGVYFLPLASGSYELRVDGPNGFSHRETFKNSSPSFQLSASVVIDGRYTYELVQIPAEPSEAERAEVALRQPVVQSGTFTVVGGSVADPKQVEAFDKAQVFTTDLITQGSACVGIDCTSSESFGFDTLRLKENNLRIKFDDTSSSSSFPNNDWQLTANDSSNGGANKFSIDDITNGKTPFTVQANAPSNALVVEASGGDVGLGTSNPAVEVHLVDGDSPTYRLEQDGSSGFTPQTWDIAGNETNFFIRDVTGGSKLPFRIKPGSPDDSIYINDDGNIGLGTDSPSEDLHVKDTSGNARMILETTDSAGHAQVYMNTGGSADWRVSNLATNGSLLFARDSGSGYTSDSVVMRAATSAVAFNTTKTMSVAGAVEASAYDILSSRTYKNELARMNGREILQKVVAMPVSVWQFKWEEGGARHLGPMAEDFAAAFEVGTGKSISLGDASGVALSAIQGLHAELTDKDAQIETLTGRLAELESLVGQLVAQ